MTGVGAGLCDSCVHQRVVRNTRGSAFSLCERSRTEPEYRKYPPVPVVRCPGWERREPAVAPTPSPPPAPAPS